MVCRLALAAISVIQERVLQQFLHSALAAMQEPIPVLVRQVVHHVRKANSLASVKVPAILAL